MRRTVPALASLAAATLVAVGAALVTGSGPAQATFPGQNGLIAFTSDRDGDEEIYTVDPTGSDRVRLTKNEGTRDGYPAWSASGNKIAYVRQPADSSLRARRITEIYKMRSDGSNKVRLTDNSVPDFYPAWSPDGTKIAFVSKHRSGNYGLYTMRGDGSQRRQIVGPGGDIVGLFQPGWGVSSADAPSWSPDGEKIAFPAVSRDSEGVVDHFLYTVNQHGTDLSPLVENATAPDWSPDGSKIAFTSLEEGRSSIEVLSLGANKQPVGAPIELTLGSDPAWSPDGETIVFNGYSDGVGYGMFKVNADASSSPTSILVCDAYCALGPAWQPRPQ